VVLDLALEGAGRALGADRAVLALVTANRSQLSAAGPMAAVPSN
jgi:hypothetical protein